MAKRKAKIIGKTIEWRERLVKIERMPASDLLDHPLNPKIHPDAQKQPLEGLLSEVGKVDILKAYLSERNEGALTLWDGHCRRELRPEEMWNVGIYDLTDDEADLLLATFDPIGWQAEQSKQRLESLMDTIKAGNSHVVSFLAEQGARLGIISQLNGHHQEGAGGDDFDTTPEDTQTRVKYGDLWECGEHRVLCGDSTKAEDVAKVMDGEKAEMMFTDPPYGVNYEGGHFHSGDVNIKRKREELDNDHDAAIYADFLPVALAAVDGPCYMWFADSKARDVYNAVFDAGCEVHALIIWHKTNATYAAMNAQYKQRHEPCLYFKPKGSTLRWCGASTEATVWSQDRDGINEFHPTQKPIALALKAIQNHEATIVADFFGGSGSTLIACERTNRKARVIEILPKYVNVTLSRWEAETGKKARKAKR